MGKKYILRAFNDTLMFLLHESVLDRSAIIVTFIFFDSGSWRKLYTQTHTQPASFFLQILSCVCKQVVKRVRIKWGK